MKYYYRKHTLTFPDTFDIKDEEGMIAYIVKAELAWGHSVKILDSNKEVLMTLDDKLTNFFFPSFVIKDKDDQKLGNISRQFSLKAPIYDFNYKGFYIRGDFMSEEYSIMKQNTVMGTFRAVERATDMYELDIRDEHILDVLTFIIGIETQKALIDN